MDLESLRGRRVALLGAGTDVTALIPHLVGVEPAVVVAFDDAAYRLSDAAATVLADAGIEVRETERLASDELGFDVAVRSPGFNRYRHELDALRANSLMTTPVDLWFGTHGKSHVVTIVTGTKGKSTTTTALAALLADLDPIVMGNIGVPPWSIATEAAQSSRPVICELSSFQASDTSYVADLAVLTSLGIDHVDWHGTVERYHDDKLGPVRRARAAIGCAGDAAVAAALGEFGGIAVDVASITADRSDALAAFFATLPAHIASNFALAVAAAERIGAALLADDVIIETLGAVDALPGRQRSLGTSGGVEAVDNALASNPLASAAGLDSYPGRHVWMIVGGADRGVPLDPLVEALGRRSPGSVTLVGIPHSGPALCAALGSHPAVRRTMDAESIVDAVAMLDPIGDDDVLLFSPTAPTPPEQGTWVDRSAAFVAAVEQRSRQA